MTKITDTVIDNDEMTVSLSVKGDYQANVIELFETLADRAGELDAQQRNRRADE